MVERRWRYSGLDSANPNFGRGKTHRHVVPMKPLLWILETPNFKSREDLKQPDQAAAKPTAAAMDLPVAIAEETLPAMSLIPAALPATARAAETADSTKGLEL